MEKSEYQRDDLIENRYRVLSVIGSGGMGTLYRVSDEVRDKAVVGFKTIRSMAPEGDVPEATDAFQNEFHVLTQLSHPNLVSVFDFGITIRGELYFTLEWIDGRSLEFEPHNRKVSDSIPIIVQICRALAYLHARGVVHGDLKPSNILICGNQVRIVDFGLAFHSTSMKIRTQYYTPGYSAPEIRRKAIPDHRIDLYSLGAIWYALLTGEPPLFISGGEYLIRLTLSEMLEPQKNIPLELITIIERLLADDPMDRYSTANEVIEAVNRVMESRHALETRETAGSYALRGRFVGREAEMQMLRRRWRQARANGGKLLFISGESGVGKTRLVEEFAVQAGFEGARVVRGQCVEGGGSAYRPWREVLRLLIRYLDGTPESRSEMKRTGPVLATLLPELWQREDMAGLAPAAELAPLDAQLRLNEAIVRTLRWAGSDRPTLIIIEDAQWADKATLELLNFLSRQPGPAGVMVCSTYRNDGSAPARSLNAYAEEQVDQIPLASLSTEVVTELVGSMLGLEELPLSLIERVQQMTSGNAFFIMELMRSLAESGEVLQRTVKGWHVDAIALQEAGLPDSIRKVVWRRLAYLTDRTQKVMQWASIIGTVFWDGLLQEIGQVARSHIQVALGEALEKAFIFERNTSSFHGQREFRFAKPAVREVVYERVQEVSRQAYHNIVSSWLMDHGDDQISEHLGLIADQLEKAGRLEESVTYLGRAGASAAAQYANTEAINYFSHALDLTTEAHLAERYEILLAREKVYNLQGSRTAQEKDLEALEEIAEIMADDGCRAKVALRRAAYADAIGDYSTAIAKTRSAIELSRSAGDVNGEAAGFLQAGRTLWGQGDYNAAQHQLKQGLKLAREEKLQQVEAKILLFTGTVSWYQGFYTNAKGYCDRALEIEREMENPVGEVWTLNMIGILYTYLGDYITGLSYFEQALQIAEEIGEKRAQGALLDSTSRLFHRWGKPDNALKYCQRALDVTQAIDDRRMAGYALMTLGNIMEGLERFDEALAALRRALALRRELGQRNLAMETISGMASVYLTMGDMENAKEMVEKILHHLQDNALDGIEERFLVYLICYRVLDHIGDRRAWPILDTACHLLKAHTARIDPVELRRSFIENVPVHKEIVMLWKKGRQS